MKPMLELAGVVAGYGSLTVLHGVDLTVGAAESVMLVGHNGSGKSTILRAIVGECEQTAGSISLLGEPIGELAPHQRVRRGIAHVPQADNSGRAVFRDLTVQANLELGGITLPKRSVRERIDEVFDLLPLLAERRRDRVGRMSGGQQQLLAVAIALVAQPKVLLLDEPTSGVASGLGERLLEDCRRVTSAAGISLLIVEQNIDLAAGVVDRVLACRSGQIVASLTPTEAKDIDRIMEVL